MRIAVIADDGEVIDTADVSRTELAAALDGKSLVRSDIWERIDTTPVRRFVGLPIPASRP